MRVESGAWIDKFQPQTLEECWLPSDTKKQLELIVESGDIPSMFFAGPAGIGKTTTAMAICNQLDADYILINASLHGNIDTVRTDIATFASTIAFNGKKKVIILDEADGLTAAAQSSLRAAINEYTNNCAFILTANFRNKLIEPLISRFNEVDFLFSKEELPLLAISLYKFIVARLEEEQVVFDSKAVQEFIKKRITRSSDIRKLLIDAQKIARTKVFNTGSLIDVDGTRLQDILPMIKSGNYDKIRTWVGENSDLTYEVVQRFLFNNIASYAPSHLSCDVITILSHYQDQYSRAIDKEITLAALLAELSKLVR